MPRLVLCCLLILATLNMSAQAGDVLPRTEADALRDLSSKPFAVLDFMGVQSGWKVIDLFAGNGYYSEALASRIGPTGHVYLHNNQAYMGFAKNLNVRVKDNRLPNVEVFVREIEDINLASDSLDMVLMVKTYHDAYFKQSGWTVTADPLFKTIHRILKPGGIVAIIDHHAIAGSGSEHAQELHRIDADFAKADIENRGFKLIDSSDLLYDADDDMSSSVFDPAVRGKTSRFVFKFRKI